MKVKVTYLLKRDCINAHCSMAKPGKSGVMSHDEAKEYFGTPCDPGILRWHQIVDESEVLTKAEIAFALGNGVEFEYITEQEAA